MSQAYKATKVKAGSVIDYTPASAVAAGDIVVQSGLVGIATRPLAANEAGSLDIAGVFDVVKVNGEITSGAVVYWDADGNPQGGTAGTGAATTTATGNTFLGWAIAAAGATAETVRLLVLSRLAVSVTTIDDLSDVGTIAYTAGDLLVADGTKFEEVALSGLFTLSSAGLLSVASATVAAAGSNQGDAGAVADGFTLVSAADGTKGVKLPAAAAGGLCVLKNNANAILKVYPGSSDAIDGLGANNALSVQPYATVTLIAYDATTWYTSNVVAVETAGAQTIAGAKTFSTMPILPAATVAAAGSAQGDAAAITSGITWVTAADATKGVKLPAAAAGLVCIVKNDDTANAVLKVYPGTGDTINALSTNAALSMAAKTACMFACYDDTKWFTVPLLPS